MVDNPLNPPKGDSQTLLSREMLFQAKTNGSIELNGHELIYQEFEPFEIGELVQIEGEMSNLAYHDNHSLYKVRKQLYSQPTREYSLLQELDCPFIPRLKGAFLYRGYDICLVTEYIPGAEDLWKHCLHTKSIPVEKIATLTANMHKALSNHGRELYQSTDLKKLIQRIEAEIRQSSDLPPIEINQDMLRDGAGTLSKHHIHGDYHLGQILIKGEDLYVIDFEGEPAKPISERNEIDLPLRDIAGMIRSFEYLTAVGEIELGDTIEMFVRTYCNEMGLKSLDQELLHLYILEKTLYELKYERTHRPDWAHIPMAKLRELANHPI